MGYFSSDNISRSKFKGDSVCHFEVLKTEAVSDDFSRLDKFMDTLKSFGKVARQKVFFTFSGYDNDERELIYIPEVVRYAKKLLNRHPYFWYFAIQLNSEFFVIAPLIDEKNMLVASFPAISKFYVNQDVENIKRVATIIGANLSIFGEEIGDAEGSLECFKRWSAVIMNGSK